MYSLNIGQQLGRRQAALMAGASLLLSALLLGGLLLCIRGDGFICYAFAITVLAGLAFALLYTERTSALVHTMADMLIACVYASLFCQAVVHCAEYLLGPQWGMAVQVMSAGAVAGVLHLLMRIPARAQQSCVLYETGAQLTVLRGLQEALYFALFALTPVLPGFLLSHGRMLRINIPLGSILAAYLALLLMSLVGLLMNHSLQITMQHAYIRSLRRAVDDFRGIKHDFYNILHAYQGYLLLHDYAGLQRYHETLTQYVQQTGDALETHDSLADNPALLGVLVGIQCRAQKLGVELNISGDFSGSYLAPINISRLFGILLDNALEEARHSARKQVGVHAERLFAREGATLHVAITNSTDTACGPDLLAQPRASSKPGHMGQGLRQVRQIIKAHANLSLRCTWENYTVTMALLLRAPLPGGAPQPQRAMPAAAPTGQPILAKTGTGDAKRILPFLRTML